ncbi:hypothetical protein DL771_009282 [Monosporascus sp. 5C6A]|nr:hypothetical protein DL771_009282 [Monosporascus sp. 5C6A]
MEALAAVGLSSNILQLVALSAKLVRTANELRHDASTSENRDHAAIAEHLETIGNGVKASAQEIEGASAAVSPEEKALVPVAQGCSELAQDLLRRLEACGVGARQADKRLNRAKRALKCMWNRREIEEINTRLQYFRSELGLHMTYGIKQDQAQSHATQASASDIRVLRDSMQALRVKSDANAAEILRSVAEVRVENSRFHAQATLAAPAALGCEASLQHLMRSLLDEYEERFLEGVEKRFRGAARLEMANARTSLLQGMQEMQVDTAETSRHDDYHSDDEYAMADQTDATTFKEEPRLECHELQWPNRQNSERPRKENISIISKTWWGKNTSLGKLSLDIKRTVVFSDYQPATSVYNLTAHLIPSPRWLATGCSFTYQSLTDPRGKPKLELQLETYRILDRDHEVWRVIKTGDITRFRTMLNQRLVSPSDRNDSAFGGELDICKALVHSGADVNTENRYYDLASVVSNVFDALVRRGIGGVGQGQRPKIPVGLAAKEMVFELSETRSKGSTSTASSPNVHIPYRGYYISERSAAQFRFLEHVISTGIADEPDCIFDSYDGDSIYDWFWGYYLEGVWDEILEEHGFDPSWVREEDERRKRVVTGETSAHEVKVGVDTAEVQQVKRRRVYERED